MPTLTRVFVATPQNGFSLCWETAVQSHTKLSHYECFSELWIHFWVCIIDLYRPWNRSSFVLKSCPATVRRLFGGQMPVLKWRNLEILIPLLNCYRHQSRGLGVVESWSSTRLWHDCQLLAENKSIDDIQRWYLSGMIPKLSDGGLSSKSKIRSTLPCCAGRSAR